MFEQHNTAGDYLPDPNPLLLFSIFSAILTNTAGLLSRSLKGEQPQGFIRDFLGINKLKGASDIGYLYNLIGKAQVLQLNHRNLIRITNTEHKNIHPLGSETLLLTSNEQVSNYQTIRNHTIDLFAQITIKIASLSSYRIPLAIRHDVHIELRIIQQSVYKSSRSQTFGQAASVLSRGFKAAMDALSPERVSQNDILQSYPVFYLIPAGGPKPIPERTGSYLEADHFWIDGRCFRMRSLRGEQTVKVNPDRTFVLKVTGDSMNQAGIEDGDYILLCWQPTADSGDIVAAKIGGEDARATLKRYLKRNGKVILSPESDNPKHKEREFDPPKPGEDQPFYIRGIAVAVFKPCGKGSPPAETEPRPVDIPPSSTTVKPPSSLEGIEAMLQNLDEETEKEFRRLVGRCWGDRKEAIRMIAEQYKRNPSASIKELIKEVHRLWDRDDGVI